MTRGARRLALSLLGLGPVRWPRLRGWPGVLRSVQGPRPARPGDDLRVPGELLSLLRRSVRRLRPARGAACSLSGGLDSATIAALLAGLGPARAFTLVDDYDPPGEWRAAAALARRYGLAHVGVRVRQDQLPDRFADAVLACGAPIWNGKGVAALVFFEGVRAAGGATLLSGCGADELLCGNPQALRSFEQRSRRERGLCATLLTTVARASLPRARPPAAPRDMPPLARRQWTCVRTVLPSSILPIELGLGTAAGLDLRLPYLDPRLAHLALRLPLRQRVRAGFGKWALRHATAGLVPDDVRWAPKIPRLAPAGGGTARARARWQALLHDLLEPGRLEALAIVDAGRVSALLERQARRSTTDEAAALADAVLLRLASLVVLAR